MRLKSLLFLVFLPFLGLSQSWEFDHVNLISGYSFFWKDTTIDSQVEYWNNGQLKVKYEKLENGNLLRLVFTSSGQLKEEAEVIQTYQVSETSIFDEFGDIIETQIDSGYTDVYAGKYRSYHPTDSSDSKQFSSVGNFELVKTTIFKESEPKVKEKYYSIPYGIWKFFSQDGILTDSIVYERKQ